MGEQAQDDEFQNFKSYNYYKSSQYTGMKGEKPPVDGWYMKKGNQKGLTSALSLGGAYYIHVCDEGAFRGTYEVYKEDPSEENRSNYIYVGETANLRRDWMFIPPWSQMKIRVALVVLLVYVGIVIGMNI